MSDPISSTSTSMRTAELAATPAKDGPENAKKVAKAASDFEALMIGELLKSSRGSDGSGWLGTDEDEAGSALTDLSEQQFAQALASRGGLGLAKLVTSGLTKQTAHQDKNSEGGIRETHKSDSL